MRDCLKTAIIVPVPIKSAVSGLIDYHPVALTPILMKCFEKLVLQHIKDNISASLTLTSMLSEPIDPQRMLYALPYTQPSHTWRIRTATSGCWLLTSTQYSKTCHLWSWLESWTIWAWVQYSATSYMTSSQIPESSDWSHLIYVNTQQRSPPGLCTQPPPVNTVNHDCTPRQQEKTPQSL